MTWCITINIDSCFTQSLNNRLTRVPRHCAILLWLIYGLHILQLMIQQGDTLVSKQNEAAQFIALNLHTNATASYETADKTLCLYLASYFEIKQTAASAWQQPSILENTRQKKRYIMKCCDLVMHASLLTKPICEFY